MILFLDGKENIETGQVILLVQRLSEIPPNPPLEKTGRGDFWGARISVGGPSSWLQLRQAVFSVPFGVDLIISYFLTIL